MTEMTKKLEIPEISARIKALRNRLGWSQSVLAEKANVTDGAVKMWETGKRFPTGKNLKNLAKALGVSESAILEGSSAPMPELQKESSDRAQLILEIQSHLTALNEDQLRTVLALASEFSSSRPADSSSFG